MGSYFCSDCQMQTLRQITQRCICCQKPSLQGFTHPKCFGKYKPDRLVSMYDYRTFPIANLLISGKYQFIPEIYLILGTSFTEFLLKENLTDFTVCVIPLSKKRERWRGFNQSGLLACQLPIPIQPLLMRSKHTKTQKDLNKLQRSKNLKNAFTFCGDSVPEKVILIDDVVTTGTTLLEATSVLKHAGIKEVWCLAIAQDWLTKSTFLSKIYELNETLSHIWIVQIRGKSWG